MKGSAVTEIEIQSTSDSYAISTLCDLVQPWYNTYRVHAHFASVSAAEKLLSVGLNFTRCLKHCTRKCPMQLLARQELLKKGDFASAIRRNDDVSTIMLALVWLDRDRQYLISTASDTVPARRSHHARLQETQDGAQHVDKIIPHPNVVQSIANRVRVSIDTTGVVKMTL